MNIKPILISIILLTGGNIGTMASEKQICVSDNTSTDISKSYYQTCRPDKEKRLFSSTAVETQINRVKALLTNRKLAWMFENCFPNTLDTTVHYRKGEDGKHDTFVYTGDIHAMWLRDSGA